MRVLLLGSDQSVKIVERRLVLLGQGSATRAHTMPSSLAAERLATEVGSATSAVRMSRYARDLKAELVILTDSETVHSGVGNVLQTFRIPCFGPTRVAADFQWDQSYKTTLLEETSAIAVDASASPKREICTVVAMIDGLRCVNVGIVCAGEMLAPFGAPPENAASNAPWRPYLPAATARELFNAILWPIIHRLDVEGSRYCGWLCVDVTWTGSWMLAVDIRCMPDPSTLEILAAADRRDWLPIMAGLAGLEVKAPSAAGMNSRATNASAGST